jgi:hypothetical protein
LIIIYSKNITPRLQYAAQVIFSNVLKVVIPVNFTDNMGYFLSVSGVKINYSEEAIDKSLHIYPSGFLFQNKIKAEFPGITDGQYSKAIFPTEGSADFNYDPFAAVFYMVSRYEEYLPHATDQHDRFNPEKVFSYQHNFYLKPMVHYWAEELKDKLQSKFPASEFPEKNFRALATIDVDNGYAYMGKGTVRTAGAYAKDLLRFKFKSFMERTHVLTGHKKDPFNYYKYQKKICNRYGVPLRYFILCSEKTDHDHSLDNLSMAFKKLVKKVRFSGKVGIHPSYYSNEDPNKLKTEIRLLSKLLRKRVRNSRQHFIRLKFPETYRMLMSYGIKTDYSMGYPDRPGFRACIAEPFPFYDLEAEEITEFMIIPFQTMDSHFYDYKKVNAKTATGDILTMMEEVRKVSGMFVFVWHDRSFAPWPEFEGWRKAFENVVKAAAE